MVPAYYIRIDLHGDGDGDGDGLLSEILFIHHMNLGTPYIPFNHLAFKTGLSERESGTTSTEFFCLGLGLAFSYFRASLRLISRWDWNYALQPPTKLGRMRDHYYY